MENGGLAKLTEGQRTCLRMVFMHMSSKDIARELGISPHTVDQRLKMAMQLLGVETRFEAARTLAKSEGIGPYQHLVYQSPVVAAADRTTETGAPVDHGSMRHDHPNRAAMREEQVAFEVASPSLKHGRLLPLPTIRGERNDLGIWQRLGWIIAIAIGSALSFGALLAGLDALARLISAATH